MKLDRRTSKGNRDFRGIGFSSSPAFPTSAMVFSTWRKEFFLKAMEENRVLGELIIKTGRVRRVSHRGLAHLAGNRTDLREAELAEPRDFEGIVNRYSHDLYRLALSLARNKETAEDLLQETFLAAYTQLDRFAGRSKLKTWLIGILLRKAARHRRYEKIRRTLSLNWLGREEKGRLENPSGPGKGKDIELRMDVSSMLATLPGKHRETLVLREILGLSYEEIAETLGIPRGTVESRLHRARKELGERLKEYFSEPPAGGTEEMERWNRE
jgi:RNA polymerase sigma-70 factor (ECF subfamily)